MQAFLQKSGVFRQEMQAVTQFQLLFNCIYPSCKVATVIQTSVTLQNEANCIEETGIIFSSSYSNQQGKLATK